MSVQPGLAQTPPIITPPVTPTTLFGGTPTGSSGTGHGQTANQKAVLNYLNSLNTTNHGELAQAIQLINGLSPSDQARAIREISGESLGMQRSAVQQNSNQLVNTMSDWLRGLERPAGGSGTTSGGLAFGGPSGNPAADRLPQPELQTVAYVDGPMPPPAGTAGVGDPQASMAPGIDPWTGFFTRGYGIAGRVAGNQNSSAFTYGVGGFLFGAHQWFSEDSLLGLFGGYGHTHVNEDFGFTNVNSFQVGAYGKQYLLENLYVQGVGAYAHDEYDSVREISFGPFSNTARGERGGNEFISYLETGYECNWRGFQLRPYAGLQYIYLDQDRLTETGGGIFNLNVARSSVSSFRSNLGGQIFYPYQMGSIQIIPRAYASWWHEFDGDNVPVTASFAAVPGGSFTVQSAQIGTNFLSAGVGFTIQINPHLSLFASYDLQTSNAFTGQAGSGGFTLQW